LIYHQRLLRSSAAPVAAVLITLGATNANALSMGKLRVQSALGQSLVAEIDLADISDDDAGSLRSEIATPSAFTGMGLEYNSALNGTQVVLQRRQNGSRYLKVTGSRALSEPFVDILVELSWASGKIVRTYTILLDPPKSQDGAPTASLPTPGPDSPAAASKPSATAAITTNSAPAPAPTAPAAPAASGANKPAANTMITPAASSNGPQRVKVNAGDNAGKIARAWATDGASVEQMLIAMLNANPTAFADNNVNRLMANTELVVPDGATAKKTSQSEAQRMVHRQNQEFQNLRRTLAGQAPLAPTSSKQSESGGKVTPEAPAPTPKTASGDTLKLSKASSQDVAEKASMEQIAQQRAKNEATERARELAKNIEELNQLAKVAAKPDMVSASTASAAAASNPSSEAGATSAAPATSAASNAAAPTVIAAVPSPAKVPAEGLLDSFSHNPNLGGWVLALLGLLGGLGWYRRVQAKKNGADGSDAGSKWNSSASTSFAVGGGQRIDTSEAQVSGLHNSIYQESQLELANELDPVAEAEVYLAYGKDVPAEEILKEGLQHAPQRVAIHLKLLAIYAKRGDMKSFEAMAHDVHALTKGSGSDWEQVLDMGLVLDPTNPLYNPALRRDPEVSVPTESFQNSTFNLEPDDLDALAPSENSASSGNNRVGDQISEEPVTASLSLPFETPAPQTATPFAVSAIPQSTPPTVQESDFATTERLDATLALAEQFLEIGEKEGARALISEVLASGNETLRKRATELLAKAR